MSTVDQIIKIGATGPLVVTLQNLLKKVGYKIGNVDGKFTEPIDAAVKDFQTKHGLTPDGKVGNMTWTALNGEPIINYSGVVLSPTLNIIDYKLQDDEYYKEVTKKDTIYLHHTAGGSNPINTIDGWERDASKSGGVLKVATAFVIGRASSSTGDATYDGKIYRAFDERYWAHHLGLKRSNNTELNSKSIGIEICNYGPLTKTTDGRFLNYVNREVNAADVYTLKFPYKGFVHYERYTNAQLASLKLLLQDLAVKYNINIRRQIDFNWFNIQNDALEGKPGIWTHTNVRSDKFDLSPQPELIEMINSL